MRRTSVTRVAPLAALAVAVAAGCSDDDGTVPDRLAQIAGSYVAEGEFGLALLTTTDPEGGSETIDWLERGASIVLTLEADGTTRGRLLIPGADEDGGDIDEDLVGTWTLEGDRVSLEHEADTFLRDMELIVEDDRLVGEETWSMTVRVELVRR